MASSLVKVRVVTPEGVAHEGEGTSVSLFTSEDSFAVWPSHINLLGLTGEGSVILKSGEGSVTWKIGPGSVKVEKNQVTFLVTRTERSAI